VEDIGMDENISQAQIFDSKVVECGYVKLIKTGRMVVCGSSEGQLNPFDVVVVHTDKGDVLGRVLCSLGRQTLPPKSFLEVVDRLPKEEGEKMLARDREREARARQIFKEQVALHRLNMHLSAVEFIYGEPKVIFYFTAPGRVDFRALVRDLASAMKMRVELRQIGVRDETKCMGGIGPCGLELCCATFLREFTSVSVKMAKEQGLFMNPQKVEGLCGKLMCCLAYEHPIYQEALKRFPQIGSVVMTPAGKGRVQNFNILTGLVKVELVEEHKVVDVAIDDIKVFGDNSVRSQNPSDGADEEDAKN
jgi:cell fate regulator YaaT (PSP1 superfamily)